MGFSNDINEFCLKTHGFISCGSAGCCQPFCYFSPTRESDKDNREATVLNMSHGVLSVLMHVPRIVMVIEIFYDYNNCYPVNS